MRTDKYIFEETKANQFNGDCAYPEPLEVGKVYVCWDYRSSVHLCPCGCGDKVFLPIAETSAKDNHWGLIGNSFSPSIQKLTGCKSHYWIKNGLVQWA